MMVAGRSDIQQDKDVALLLDIGKKQAKLPCLILAITQNIGSEQHFICFRSRYGG